MRSRLQSALPPRVAHSDFAVDLSIGACCFARGSRTPRMAVIVRHAFFASVDPSQLNPEQANIGAGHGARIGGVTGANMAGASSGTGTNASAYHRRHAYRSNFNDTATTAKLSMASTSKLCEAPDAELIGNLTSCVTASRWGSHPSQMPISALAPQY